MRNYNIGLLSLVSLGSLAAASASYAQTAGVEQTRSASAMEADGAIVVTARRREEALQDVPISITALSGAALARQGVQNIQDVTARVPSLSITTTSNIRSVVAFAIRGQRSQEPQLLTDPPVGTYFAEVVQPRPYGFGNALYDLQSVQVLKGVQGTLFGRNMTGGAVLVEPNRPTQDFTGELRGTLGNYDLRELYGMLNVPVTEGIAVRVAGKTRQRDGWAVDVSNGRRYDNQDFTTFRASVLLTPFQGFESNLIVDFYNADEVGGAAFATTLRTPSTAAAVPGFAAAFREQQARFAAKRFRFDPGPGDGGRFDAFNRQPFEKNRNIGFTNKTTYELNDDLTVKNIFGYRHVQRRSLTDYDGTPVTVIAADQYANIKSYSEELQLQGKALDNRLDFVLGGFYFLEKGLDGSRSSQFPGLSITAASPATLTATTLITQNGAVGRSTSYAAYAAGTLALTDTIKLSGGIRYNYDKRKATVGPRQPNRNLCVFDTDINTPGTQTVPIDQCSFTASKSWDAITWDATIQWEPSQATSIYASTRRGFRAGGFSTRASNYPTFTPFNPETVQEYEIGMKNNLDIGAAKLTTSTAVFYQDYKNVQKQRTFAGPPTVTIIDNTAKQENFGGEFEASLDFRNGLTVAAFYAYVGVNIKEGRLPGEYELRGTPHHQVGGSINYASDITGMGSLNLNANASYRSRNHLDEFDVEGDEPGYALLNLRASIDGIAGTPFGAALFMNNVTNKLYRVGVLGLNRELGFVSSVYGEPRMYGLELSAKF